MNLFYELIQVVLGKKDCLSEIPSETEWRKLYDIAQKQAVAGFAFIALDKLSKQGQKPPLNLLFEWIGLSEQIRNRNQLVNQRCKEITCHFKDAGFDNCILKGQGNAGMYPIPESRTSGDIDIWVNGDRKDIIKFVRQKFPKAFEQYIHIDYPIYDDVPVEVHFTPGELIIPKYDKRFQEWAANYGKSLFDARINSQSDYMVPSIGFNAVFQMVHIVTHFFIEGIGLRHFVDYYYVLVKVKGERLEVKEIQETLCWLGLEKFARGVMGIEQYCLGLEERYLLFEPSEKIGKVILKEMEEGGNFGQYDERYSLRSKGLLARGVADAYRLVRLSTIFPKRKLMENL